VHVTIWIQVAINNNTSGSILNRLQFLIVVVGQLSMHRNHISQRIVDLEVGVIRGQFKFDIFDDRVFLMLKRSLIVERWRRERR
jgi:hypothetical protein